MQVQHLEITCSRMSSKHFEPSDPLKIYALKLKGIQDSFIFILIVNKTPLSLQLEEHYSIHQQLGQ